MSLYAMKMRPQLPCNIINSLSSQHDMREENIFKGKLSRVIGPASEYNL